MESNIYEIEELENQYIDEPNSKETMGGLLVGLIYLFVLPSLLYSIFGSIFKAYTLIEANAIMLAAEIGSALLTIFLMYTVCKRNYQNILKSFDKKYIGEALKYACIVILASTCISMIYTLLDINIDTNANQSALNEAYLYTPVLSIIYTCLCAPIVEELTFRYFIFKPIFRKHKILAFIVSGSTFALIHMIASVTTFAADHNLASLLNDLMSLPIYIAAGVIFCMSYYKTNKIGTSIMAHAFYNTIISVFSLIQIFSAPIRYKSINVDDNSLSINLIINETLNVTIDEIKTYTKEDENEILVNYTVDGNYIFVNNLESGKLYYVDITYTYDDDSNIGNNYRTQEVISTYVKGK